MNYSRSDLRLLAIMQHHHERMWAMRHRHPNMRKALQANHRGQRAVQQRLADTRTIVQ